MDILKKDVNRISIFTVLWNKLGSIHLTVVLCLLLTADLAAGYVCLNRRSVIFAPLNEIGLPEWMGTYGMHNLESTAWFFVLMPLLALLCINTFVCTTDRVVRLFKSRSRHPSILRFCFRLAPHVMHYALIVILIGYLSSYMFAQVLETRTLLPGGTMTLPGTGASIRFDAFQPEYYEAGRLATFRDRVLQPVARLVLSDGDSRRTALLKYNHPVWFKSFGIFLKDFAPKSRTGGMGMKVRINVSIRKDPGVVLYLAGMLLFTAGMAMYITEWIFLRKRK